MVSSVSDFSGLADNLKKASDTEQAVNLLIANIVARFNATADQNSANIASNLSSSASELAKAINSLPKAP